MVEDMDHVEPDMYEAYKIMFEYLVENNSPDPNQDLGVRLN